MRAPGSSQAGAIGIAVTPPAPQAVSRKRAAAGALPAAIQLYRAKHYPDKAEARCKYKLKATLQLCQGGSYDLPSCSLRALSPSLALHMSQIL